MSNDNILFFAIVRLPVLLMAVTVHEFFHAWSANKFGDPTAKNMGRLTLHPFAHLDLMGSLCFFMSQFQFGWAKPVPVNPMNLENLRRDDFWISFAGPLSNLGQAIIFALIFRMIYNFNINVHEYFFELVKAGIFINIGLFLFNLIPLFPLDGSHMLRSMLPDRYEASLDQFERFSPFILILFIITGLHWTILRPFYELILNILLG